MDAQLRRPWTQDEFFAWAETQDGRYEFDGFQPVDMNGGTINHALIIRNLNFACAAVCATSPARHSGRAPAWPR